MEHKISQLNVLRTRDKKAEEVRRQYSTFTVSGRVYGIDVTKVQEVVKPLPMTRIPLALPFVRGLINLRGQVATAIGLRELLGFTDDHPLELMNVVCRSEGSLVSLLVDEIGDVIEVSGEDYEGVPKTIPDSVRKYLAGVYKLRGSLLSVIDIEKIFKHINK